MVFRSKSLFKLILYQGERIYKVLKWNFVVSEDLLAPFNRELEQM